MFTHNTIGSAPRLLSSAGRQPLAVTCTCHVWVGLFGAILVGVVPLLASMWLPICLVRDQPRDAALVESLPTRGSGWHERDGYTPALLNPLLLSE